MAQHSYSLPRRVVMLGIDVPRAIALHAGGRYLNSVHDYLLDNGVEVTSIGPHVNDAARGRPRSGGTYIQVGTPVFGIAILDEWIRRIIWHVDPTLPDFRLVLGLLFSRRIRQSLRAADLVDLQWSELGWLIGLIKRLNPRARIVVTMHDVLQQKYERRAALATGRRARQWRRAGRRSAGLEKYICQGADVVAALSEKDGNLIRAASRTLVTVPPIAVDTSVVQSSISRNLLRCVFAGAMHRPENDDAALWLLHEIWPRVVHAVPDASLVIVGARPTERVVRAASESTNVEVTGFVQDVESYYDDALVALVPLRAGAGVKFKTIDAILRGCVVVSSTIGSEGVGADDWYWSVTDDAAFFADAIVLALEDPERALLAAKRSGSLAAKFYSQEAQARAFEQVYSIAFQRGA